MASCLCFFIRKSLKSVKCCSGRLSLCSFFSGRSTLNGCGICSVSYLPGDFLCFDELNMLALSFNALYFMLKANAFLFVLLTPLATDSAFERTVWVSISSSLSMSSQNESWSSAFPSGPVGDKFPSTVYLDPPPTYPSLKRLTLGCFTVFMGKGTLLFDFRPVFIDLKPLAVAVIVFFILPPRLYKSIIGYGFSSIPSLMQLSREIFFGSSMSEACRY